MRGAPGTLLFGVFESAEAFEAGLPYEIEELFEFARALPRMPHDERCPQHHSGHLAAQPFNESPRPGAVNIAVHAGKHFVGDMLERDVHVTADLGIVRHLPEDVLREALGIGIVDADPLYFRDFGKGAEHIGQPSASIEVEPVIGGVLGDEQQLLHSLRGEGPGLLHDLFDRNGAVRAADMRNGAVGTAAVAAFGYLQICAGPAVGRQVPGGAESLRRHGAEGPHYRIEVAGPEPSVHFGHQPGQFRGVALRQAAECEEMPRLAGTAPFGLFQQHVHALFLGVADEAAGVYEHVIHRPVPVFRQHHIPVPGQLRKQMLGVYGILGTAEGEDLYASHPYSALGASSPAFSSSSTKSREACFTISLYQSRTLRMWET